ncbi:MAG TPA: hypothetical protein IGP91_11960 [Thermosynechococcus sp. M46_R2017_013]|nr:hypothetical protein [Thermosynechococcus sp. M46_R2017_013]
MQTYQQLLETKLKTRWEPIDPIYTPIHPALQETIARAVAFKELELSVASFLESASKRDLPVDEYGWKLMASNQHDEEVHDIALSKLAASLPFYTDRPEVLQIKSQFEDLANRCHPIEVARTLESGVFFVCLGILRVLGSVATRNVASDVLRDEAIHVATNTQIAKSLGVYNQYPQLERLRRDAVAWLTEELLPDRIPAAYAKYDQSFWLSKNFSGKDMENEVTKATYMAFFEVDRRNQPVYN